MDSEHASSRSAENLPRSEPRLALSPTPDGLEQRLLAHARAAGLGAGDRVVVGFSGGRDSLALAGAMRRVASVLGIAVTLLHVDHRLRPESGAEARRAEALARRLGLPARVVAADAPASRHPGVGVEEAARRERYRLLASAAAAEGAVAIATAHHLDDQAETVLLHLLRGGGVHGAGAMAERSPVPGMSGERARHNISLESPWLWRPLLSEPRCVIDGYVGRLRLDPIEDPTNADTTLRRNTLRHTIIPLVEAAFPGASAALARYAALAADDDRALDDLAAAALSAASTLDSGLEAAGLDDVPLAVGRRMVRRWLGAATGLAMLSAERTEAVLELARRGRGGQIEIGEGWAVSYRQGMLRVARDGPEARGRGA